MEYWNGFEMIKEDFLGTELITVVPKKPNGKWAIKTEYFDAFPDVQVKLLEKGYYVFCLKNITRWHINEDTDRRAKLSQYVIKKYSLKEKCVIIGMSCGGMQGIYFATSYPEFVSCMYLDAPVVNFLSCPFALGKAVKYQEMIDEFVRDKNITQTEAISYRDNPLDRLDELVKHKIPLILVSGDSDTVVPFEENGEFLKRAYEENGCIIETIIKKGADHHPHSLENNSQIIHFIEKYDK